MNVIPRYHFAPRFGWMNDPNGLIYHDGVYEFYFQHNPKAVTWGNMTWGHARTKDLVHFEELPPVLFPDEKGTMFSGCAVMNDQGLLGLPKTAILYFYTLATHPAKEGKEPKPFEIRLAYSLDGGDTLIKTGGPVLESLAMSNRDPKVFYHEPSKAYVLVLWLEENDVGFFRSTDLTHFELSARQKIDGAFECPDLFELPVYELALDPWDTTERPQYTKENKWVFWSADGGYTVGTFDGYRFYKEQGRRRSYQSGLPYAAQSYSNLPVDPKTGLGRVINQAWLRTKCIGEQTTGVASLPRELSLIKAVSRFSGKEEYILSQKLAEEAQAALNGLCLHFGHHNFTLKIKDEKKDLLSSIRFLKESSELAITYENVTSYHRLFCPTKVNAWQLVVDQGLIEFSSQDGSVLFIEDLPYLRSKEIFFEVGEE